MTNMNLNPSSLTASIKHISQAHSLYEFDSYVVGADDMDVTVAVTHYFKQAPIHNADNPDDYYGYTEFDYEIYDSRGFRNQALEAACTDDDTQRFLIEYELALEAEAEPDYEYYMDSIESRGSFY